eukprot:SAG31_NODE_3306_length_4437_cov_46.404564_5_plen_92_part_00
MCPAIGPALALAPCVAARHGAAHTSRWKAQKYPCGTALAGPTALLSLHTERDCLQKRLHRCSRDGLEKTQVLLWKPLVHDAETRRCEIYKH